MRNLGFFCLIVATSSEDELELLPLSAVAHRPLDACLSIYVVDQLAEGVGNIAKVMPLVVLLVSTVSVLFLEGCGFRYAVSSFRSLLLAKITLP